VRLKAVRFEPVEAGTDLPGMRRSSEFVTILLTILLMLGGCRKKQMSPVPPPQQQAPTLTAPSPPQSEPETPAPAETEKKPEPPPEESSVKATKPKQKPKPRKPAPKPTEEKPPSVSEEPKPSGLPDTAASGTTLGAGLSAGQAQHQRQTALQLRNETEANLASLNRSLSADERSMAQQIHAFLQQSRAAESDGDTERAYNLALKAHLLCDELTKH